MAQLPKQGDLQRPDLKVGDRAYAMRGNILQIWKLGSVVETFMQGAMPTYKLKFDVMDTKGQKVLRTQSKILQPRFLAYADPAPVRLPVGTRVIAVYRDPSEESASGPAPHTYYSGVVAEPPKNMNRFRYLIFFDDGYASYIPHDEIRVVARQSKDVWDDVHVNSKEFVRKYLLQYPERPMVKMTVGQVVRTEWEGRWLVTRVQEVDASLVRLRFEVDGRVENIYRGSTRLGPLFMELQQQKKRKEALAQGGGGSQVMGSRRHQLGSRRDGPYVEYTRQQDATGEAEDPGMPGLGAKAEVISQTLSLYDFVKKVNF